jgi:hypothetical protein
LLSPLEIRAARCGWAQKNTSPNHQQDRWNSRGL